MHRRLIVVSAAAVVLALMSCGEDSEEGSAFAVGDCATPVDPEFTLDVEEAGEVIGLPLKRVVCDDQEAQFTVTAVAVSEEDLGPCSTFTSVDGQLLCLGPVEGPSQPAEGKLLDIATLKPGDCTDSVPQAAEPTQKLPCDDPRATAEVIESAPDVLSCGGDIAYQSEGVVICMLSR